MNIRLLQTNRTCSRSVSYHFNSSLITNSTPTAWIPSSPPSSPTHIRLTGLFHSRSSNSELKNRICEFQLVIDTEVFLTSLMFLSLNRSVNTTTRSNSRNGVCVCVCFQGVQGQGSRSSVSGWRRGSAYVTWLWVICCVTSCSRKVNEGATYGKCWREESSCPGSVQHTKKIQAFFF